MHVRRERLSEVPATRDNMAEDSKVYLGILSDTLTQDNRIHTQQSNKDHTFPSPGSTHQVLVLLRISMQNIAAAQDYIADMGVHHSTSAIFMGR